MFNGYDRSLRVAALLRRELSDLLRSKVKDPRTSQVTIIDVRSTRSLSQAKVYIRAPELVDRKQVMAGLTRSAGFLRKQLGLRLKMRCIPELKFIFDETLEQSERINQLIASDALESVHRTGK